MASIITLVLKRLALGCLTLLLVSVLIFSAITLLPGDFAQTTLGDTATPETVSAFRKEIGLDQPPLKRYLGWMMGIANGDFGSSFSSRPNARRTVMDILSLRLRNTAILAGTTAVVTVPLAIGLGLLCALWRNSWVDRIIGVLTLAALSMPEFFLAYIAIFLFAVKFPIFPSLSTGASASGAGVDFQGLVLPVVVLTSVTLAHMMRMTRATVVSVLASPFIQMAVLKGIPPTRIILRHALPNAWGPIVNVIALNLAYLIVGVVVVEVVFVYPGVGQAMVDAVRFRDIPVVQACALLFAATYIVLNLIADVISIATNPRLLHPR